MAVEGLHKDHYITWTFRGLLGLGVTLIGFAVTTLVGDLKTTYATVIEQKEAIRYLVNSQTEVRARVDQMATNIDAVRERVRALEARSRMSRDNWPLYQYGDEQ